MDKVDKIKIGILYLIRGLLLTAVGGALFLRNWNEFWLAAFALICSFLPEFIERKMRVDYPSEFEISAVILIYASIYLGEAHLFYEKLWWWDIFLHGLSSLTMGSIGFLLVYILNRQKKIPINLSPGFMALFAFCFAVSIGALWEIVEFFIDIIFKTNMQKSGLIDTMWDLIINCLGALAISIPGYFYLKGDISIFERFERKFLATNKDVLQ